MPARSALLLLILSFLSSASCTSGGAAPRDPGRPTPVGRPDPAVTTGRVRPGEGGIGAPDGQRVPVRPDQAPLVAIRDVLEEDSLLGRRVRVAGRCTLAGEGRRAGSWALTAPDASIEVRGRVPGSCTEAEGQSLTIFAQVERTAANSGDRLLLRLPD